MGQGYPEKSSQKSSIRKEKKRKGLAFEHRRNHMRKKRGGGSIFGQEGISRGDETFSRESLRTKKGEREMIWRRGEEKKLNSGKRKALC